MKRETKKSINAFLVCMTLTVLSLYGKVNPGCVFDAKAAREGRSAGYAALDLTIDGVEVDEKQSWRHVDKRVTKNKPVAVVNLVHTVFRAIGSEATISISNAAAPDSSELGANYISLSPYYPEDL